METVKIAVCDDLKTDREHLKKLLEEYVDLYGYLIEVDEYESGEELLEADVSEYNLIFLDIFMKEINGIKTAELFLSKNNNVQIVFCSTSNEFAAESYDVAALRYLIKPVEKDKLFRTLDRFFRMHTVMKRLVYKQNRMDESILLSEVLWIEAENHKSIIHTKNGDIITSTSVKQFAEQLEGDSFVKPIRYALVSMNAIKTMTGAMLILTDDTSIPVSRGVRDDVKKSFSEYKMKTLLEKGGIR